jgi:hypothetical protein
MSFEIGFSTFWLGEFLLFFWVWRFVFANFFKWYFAIGLNTTSFLLYENFV